MPTGAEQWCADTSVAVAALDASHEGHDASRVAALRRRPALAGHAAFETYAVLTRLPGVARVAPSVAAQAIERAFPERCWLTPAAHDGLVARLAPLGIVGGMVYDALVGEAVRVAGRRLLTRDLRALRVYELLEVPYELID
jgi:hypothetical protein